MTNISRRLADVSVPQIESYLLSKNWRNDGQIRKVATVWHRQDSEEAEVVLPLSELIKDFQQRLQDALSAIAFYEQRAVVDVINDVVRFLANVITVRVIHRDTEGGTIPINDGVLLVAKAKELLYAAAMSMYVKKRQFLGAPPKDAKSYIDSLLLGQTEIGSYVVNVIAPIQPGGAMSGGAEEVPPVEAVTLNLTSGLAALSAASDLYGVEGDPTVFESAIRYGASANMCDALLGFSGAERKREFEVRISGAAGPMFEGETKVFTFDADHVEALALASDYYKDDYILHNREIIGFIKRLSRPQGEEEGTITVEASISDADRSVQIKLGASDYHKAILAHDAKAAVKCRGDIHIKSRRVRLLNLSNFDVVEVNELF
jgi:hypothetical protein